MTDYTNYQIIRIGTEVLFLCEEIGVPGGNEPVRLGDHTRIDLIWRNIVQCKAHSIEGDT